MSHPSFKCNLINTHQKAAPDTLIEQLPNLSTCYSWCAFKSSFLINRPLRFHSIVNVPQVCIVTLLSSPLPSHPLATTLQSQTDVLWFIHPLDQPRSVQCGVLTALKGMKTSCLRMRKFRTVYIRHLYQCCQHHFRIKVKFSLRFLLYLESLIKAASQAQTIPRFGALDSTPGFSVLAPPLTEQAKNSYRKIF
jgi:hypothetical protein